MCCSFYCKASPPSEVLKVGLQAPPWKPQIYSGGIPATSWSSLAQHEKNADSSFPGMLTCSRSTLTAAALCYKSNTAWNQIIYEKHASFGGCNLSEMRAEKKCSPRYSLLFLFSYKGGVSTHIHTCLQVVRAMCEWTLLRELGTDMQLHCSLRLAELRQHDTLRLTDAADSLLSIQ